MGSTDSTVSTTSSAMRRLSPGGARGVPRSLARHWPYRVAAASARTASSGIEYTGMARADPPVPVTLAWPSSTPRIPRKTAATGFVASWAASRTAAATSSSPVASGGMKQASTESTRGSSKAARRAVRNSAAVDSLRRSAAPWVTVSPQPVQASAARVPSAAEFATTATRSPVGSGWWVTSCATSKSWWTFSTRMTPACLSIAENTSGRALVARTRWPGGTPNRLTPDLTTMTGLIVARLRAIRENLRGLPIDSR